MNFKTREELNKFLKDSVGAEAYIAEIASSEFDSVDLHKLNEYCDAIYIGIVRLGELLQHKIEDEDMKQLFDYKSTVGGLIELLEVEDKEDTKLYAQLNSIECEVCDYRTPTKLEKKLIEALSEAIVSM